MSVPSGLRAAERVVVFRTGHLGDTVCAIPAFRLVRSHFPDAELTLLCDRPLEEQKVPACQRGRTAGAVRPHRQLPERPRLANAGELYAAVRPIRPSVLVNLPQMDRPASVMLLQRGFFRLCGVRRLIGFRCHN